MGYREGDLELDFPGAVSLDKLDARGRKTPTGMKLVDFVVEESVQYLLVEVKDPSQSGATPVRRQKFLAGMKENKLADGQIVPKFRDSYCFLHLMARDTKPCFVVFLLGTRNLSVNAAMLMALHDRIKRRIIQEADSQWARQYATGFWLLTELEWAKRFPHYPLTVH